MCETKPFQQLLCFCRGSSCHQPHCGLMEIQPEKYFRRQLLIDLGILGSFKIPVSLSQLVVKISHSEVGTESDRHP